MIHTSPSYGVGALVLPRRQVAQVLQPFGEPFTARLVDDFVGNSAIAARNGVKCPHWEFIGTSVEICRNDSLRYVKRTPSYQVTCIV